MGTEVKPGVLGLEWASWQRSAPYTVGLEEEAMLLDARDWSLAQRGDDILPQLSPDLAEHISGETHQAAIEVATEPHETVGAAIAQLRDLRARLAAELAGFGVAVAGAGTHPFALWDETQVSESGRYQVILRTMADLARREPTFALHVHIGVAEPDAAIRLMSRLRAHLPLLLALSANSPFWQGRATGLASTRTPVFGAFPRTGIPRRYVSYEDWVRTVDALLRCGAFPEPTFLWWDIRPQPSLGTVEVRVMDAQTSLYGTAALTALIQSVARLELEEGYASPALVAGEELLAENRFLASRDGIEARLLDPDTGRRRPARDQLDELLEAARPHAEALGCRAELEAAGALGEAPGFARQLAIFRQRGDLRSVVGELAGEFAPDG
ncbi:MAG: glutamate---cysteine ligase / carboxylate-amine ligase [Solirubrobacteraceae bacterium]|jgi:carboxylate-amine ligase|nr:glutamate---cysteine ligase / carboxylate-amine ligase [Solirubrobacteraceae bacterium]